MIKLKQEHVMKIKNTLPELGHTQETLQRTVGCSKSDFTKLLTPTNYKENTFYRILEELGLELQIVKKE